MSTRQLHVREEEMKKTDPWEYLVYLLMAVMVIWICVGVGVILDMVSKAIS